MVFGNYVLTMILAAVSAPPKLPPSQFFARSANRGNERYLKPALIAELIEMTLADKPNSRLQKYRLTAKGQRWLEQL